ncbi:MAG: hypothetical protein AAB489_00365 [Patescibacteria group bacterium]
MKKFSLLIGALGGALGGYLLSNTKLREGLLDAKDPEHAAKLLAKHLKDDGKKIAKEAQNFLESKEVQNNIAKARKFAAKKMHEAKKQVGVFVKQGGDRAVSAMKKKVGSAKSKSRAKSHGFTSEEVA